MDRLEEGRVVVGQGALGRRQAARGAAHRRRLPFGGGRVDALPAQGVGQSALRRKHRERCVAFVRQGLAGAAPDRLGVADPLRVGATQRLAGIQLGAAQADALDRRFPCGQERPPVLAPRGRRQPEFAEGLADRIPAMAAEEVLCLLARQRVDAAAQTGVFDPPVQRMAHQVGVFRGVEPASFGRIDRHAHACQLRIERRSGWCPGWRGGYGRWRLRASDGGEGGRECGEYDGKRARQHGRDYSPAPMNVPGRQNRAISWHFHAPGRGVGQLCACM